LWLGGISAIGGLISVAATARAIDKAAVEAAGTPVTTAAQAVATAQAAAAQKSLYGY
jgi:hypothetical protein